MNVEEPGLEDYLQIVPHPMDFGTIRTNLESDSHYTTPESVLSDIALVFDNCYKYNQSGNSVSLAAQQLQKHVLFMLNRQTVFAEEQIGIVAAPTADKYKEEQEIRFGKEEEEEENKKKKKKKEKEKEK